MILVGPGVWGYLVLALGWLGQVDSGREYEDLMNKVVRASKLVGLHLKSTSVDGG